MDAKPTCHEMRIDRSFSLFQINVISNEHFTVIEDTAVTEEFLCMFLLVERQLWHIHAECANYYVNFVNLC